jgi:long-chain acyl-CoA synthetase
MDDVEVPRTVPEALTRAAAVFGANAAYVEGGGARAGVLTWAGLSRRAQDVAAGLISLGLNPGDRVAICAENCIDWLVAFHATVAANACVTLVYYGLKSDEIEEQIRRPGSRFLFASESVLRKFAGDGPPVERTILIGPSREPELGFLSLDAVAGAATAADRETLASRAPAPDDLAAIVYTSGTTGGPKGVMLSHRNLVSSAQSAIVALNLTSSDSALLVLPLHHSLAFTVAAILPPLIGGTIVLENDLRRLRERLREHRPTIFFGVPALFELMYRGILARAEAEGRLGRMQAWQARVQAVKRLTGVNIGPLVFRELHQAFGGRIRFLVSGAAALKPQTQLDFLSLGLPLIQGCGVTEVSSALAVQRFSKRRLLFTRYYENHTGSVGQALPGVEVSLIDVPEKDIHVATDGEGELVVRGPSVFLGYWQAPEATSAAMADGWVRTGDLARIDNDGNIYLTGRVKFIIVLDSGEKVYPDEVEEKLEQSDLIEDVCVTGRRSRDKTVVTAVIYPNVEAVQARLQADGAVPDGPAVERMIAEEVERLSKTLADYKRVARLELADEPLPKTAVRKVARGRLADTYTFDYARWVESQAAADTATASP